MLDPKHKRTEFLRHYLLLVVLAGLWLLFDNRHEITSGTSSILSYFVAGLLFVVIKKNQVLLFGKSHFHTPKGILVLDYCPINVRACGAFFVFRLVFF